MLKKFQKFIKDNNLFTNSDKILLSVSGGIDSTVMSHLFWKSNYNFAIAHCNFQLRKKESNRDEKFVENLAQQMGVDFFVKQFDTTAFAKKNKISIQMAARELRYNWFEHICKKHNFNYLATAHHIDDSIETFFINIFRKTGITGLEGIPVKRNNIIRPLLFAFKKDIVEYANKNSIKYVEDSSNIKTDYLRNKIRHFIIPALSKSYVNYNNALLELMKNVKDANQFINFCIKNIKKELLIYNSNEIKINKSKLLSYKENKFILYEIIKNFNFNIDTVNNIISTLNNQPGKCFFSNTHKLIIDRNFIIIKEKNKNNTPLEIKFNINKTITNIEEPVKLIFEKKTVNKNFLKKIFTNKNKNIAYLDADKIKSPLIIRKWKKGDKFIPLGMENFKKLSDFFVDEKLSLFDKENVYVLCNDDNIIWVINYRIDNRYKIDENTKNILICKLK